MNPRTRVAVAMSGGVDSSVAAALLIEEGYEVIGLMLRLWSEPGAEADNRCCTPDAMAQARRVAAILGIPFYALDAQQVFHDVVVQAFLTGYAQGITPNPCLTCNRLIRWGFLLQQAQAFNAQFLATGHYARLRRDAQGRIELQRAVDREKDQSYVLHVLTQEQLRQTLLPLGALTKPQVRELAKRFNLPVAERPDSQDLCFLGGKDYRPFLLRHAPELLRPGPIYNRQGTLLGQHQGLAFYTIGQRKGLGLSAPHPLYVIEKDLSANALIVGQAEELGEREMTVAAINWIRGEPPAAPFQAEVKIRYTARPSPALVTPLGRHQAHLTFTQPQRDITPGQAAVFYQDELCLGGGIIQATRIKEEEP